MFSTVATSLVMAFGFGFFAIDFPAIQNVMLICAAMAAMAFCCSLEAWDCEEPATRSGRLIEPDRAREGAD
jgi:thymidine kinase